MPTMDPPRPPEFASIADGSTRAAFLRGHPETVEWLPPGTKLFKWTKSITTKQGISPWWQFLESRWLATGAHCPGIQEFQEYAARLKVGDRDYARARVAVTKQFNKMTNAVAIRLVKGAWAYIGKAAGQLKDKDHPGVYLIGGEYQVWVPGLMANDITRTSILPYLKPNAPFGAR
jgi:hypothetical protein